MKYYLILRIMVRYCECFASGVYCDGCNCVNCHNNVENEGPRREAVEATLERNPNAFRPKIASSPHGARDSRVLFELKVPSHQTAFLVQNISSVNMFLKPYLVPSDKEKLRICVNMSEILSNLKKNYTLSL